MRSVLKKTLMVILFVLLVWVLFSLYQSYKTSEYETSPDGNVIYYGTSSSDESVQEYEADCADRGGTLLTCTSPPGNITAVCYYGCELPI